MKTKKTIIRIAMVIALYLLWVSNTYADFGSDLIGDFFTSLLIVGAKWLNYVVWFIIAFVAWVLTFWILFISYLLDLIFIKVPYIWDIIWEWWDVVYIQTVKNFTNIVLLLSIWAWLMLGWVNYIKDVIDRLTLWLQSWSKWSIFRDIWGKFIVVLLIFSIPYSLPSLFKGVNSLSSGILAMEISEFSDEDKIVIQSKPITSLVELWLWIPAVDFLDDDLKTNKDNIKDWKIYTSIHNQQSWDWIENWEINLSKIIESIIDKSLFQFWRILNLAWGIIEIEWLNENNKDENLNSGTEDERWGKYTNNMYEWAKNWVITFLFITIIYIVLLYIVFMKLFALLMSLVTRFVNILMTSMYLSFHIAMLWSENTKWFWAKNIWSFVWDILVTPLIAAFVWMWILILWFFASVMWAGNEWFMYFGIWSEWDEYQSALFSWMLIMIILWGMLNKLHKVVEYVWANFENIVSTKWWQWMQDSYSNPGEAMGAASKVFWMAKTTWWIMSLWMVAKWMQKAKTGIPNYVKWTMLGWDNRRRIAEAKEAFKVDEVKKQLANNTKINKK